MTEGDGQFCRKLLTNPSGELQCFDCAQHRQASFDCAQDRPFDASTALSTGKLPSMLQLRLAQALRQAQDKQGTESESKRKNLLGQSKDCIEKGRFLQGKIIQLWQTFVFMKQVVLVCGLFLFMTLEVQVFAGDFCDFSATPCSAEEADLQ
jgi:hypothetical protein